ncbi:MAG: hypothetical protein U9Q27_01555 [Patescibacteria group bacterium]|nr:hypothetical protein [Patescibacteria group bacterium]
MSNKKYPIIDVPASGKKSWMGGAYTLCFIYSKYKGNFVLRGYYKEVEEYLKKNYTHYFCNFSLWYEGFSRNIWKFWKENIGIFQPDRHYLSSNRKYKIRPYSDLYADDKIKKANKNMELEFKRLPKK